METERIKEFSRKYVQNLTKKFDKVIWKKTLNSGIYKVDFNNSGSIHIAKDEIFIFNGDGLLVAEYKPTAEEADAYNHIVLWGKIKEKFDKERDKILDDIINELNNLK